MNAEPAVEPAVEARPVQRSDAAHTVRRCASICFSIWRSRSPRHGFLKLDGPYYADGIAAGIYVVGFLIALWSFRSDPRRAKRTTSSPAYRSAPVFAALAIFFLAAAVAVIWFTYISPPDAIYPEEGVATAMLLTLRRQFA